MAMIRAIEVQPLEGYKLLLSFDNGEHRIYDMSNCLFGVFEFLKNPLKFNSVELVDGSPTWYPPGGDMEVDICPDTVYIDGISCDKFAAKTVG